MSKTWNHLPRISLGKERERERENSQDSVCVILGCCCQPVGHWIRRCSLVFLTARHNRKMKRTATLDNKVRRPLAERGEAKAGEGNIYQHMELET